MIIQIDDIETEAIVVKQFLQILLMLPPDAMVNADGMSIYNGNMDYIGRIDYRNDRFVPIEESIEG